MPVLHPPNPPSGRQPAGSPPHIFPLTVDLRERKTPLTANRGQNPHLQIPITPTKPPPTTRAAAPADFIPVSGPSFPPGDGPSARSTDLGFRSSHNADDSLPAER